MDQAPAASVQRYRSRKGTIAAFYFVTLHTELSRIACLWMLLGRCAGYAAAGILHLDAGCLRNALGQAEDIVVCIASCLALADLRTALED